MVVLETKRINELINIVYLFLFTIKHKKYSSLLFAPEILFLSYFKLLLSNY